MMDWREIALIVVFGMVCYWIGFVHGVKATIKQLDKRDSRLTD